MTLIQKIAAGLAIPGKSGKGLAEALGINPSQVSRMLNGERAIKAFEIPMIEKYLGVSLLGYEDTQEPKHLKATEYSVASVPFPDRGVMPLDVPVLGTVIGGNGGDFQMSGEMIDYVRRPPGITHARNVFALHVRGTSMSPRFEEGELLYLNPNLPTRVGDYVVIEFIPSEANEYGEGCLKRFVCRTPTKLVVEQFNPACQLEFDLDRIKAIHRVLTLHELLGI